MRRKCLFPYRKLSLTIDAISGNQAFGLDIDVHVVYIFPGVRGVSYNKSHNMFLNSLRKKDVKIETL